MVHALVRAACAPSFVAVSLALPLSAQSFVNFESGPVQPIRIAADGSRLFVADTIGGRLAVFDLADPSSPFLLAEIPVGIDPVSVNPRTRDEVWVTNLVSDSISIVSVPERRVVATLRVVDEPSDVVFAGGKAFVSVATRDEVRVFDAVTRAPLGTIPIFGKDPRSLAVSNDGTKVYAVVQRSGNGTTVLREGLFAPPPPTNPALPPAPAQSLIVRADNPAYAAHVPFTLPDQDVAEIDVASQAVARWFRQVGTINTAIAVHPTTGDLWVTNIESKNLVRFEPNLRGHAIDSRVTRITTGATPTVTPIDLNPGIDYTVLPNSSALATALSEPFGVAIDAAAGRVYVAAHGTDRVGVLSTAGAVLARIEIGNTPGAAVDTRQKRGPRALALHPASPRLYVLNRLSDTLSVVDTSSLTVVREQAIHTVDPMPATMRQGRKFLYDAKLSGNGTMSCAACHIDGDTDGIAWDLGDPSGVLEPAPPQPFPFNIGITSFHPMKGPMATQTLRGLVGTGVLHWRGDRSNFQAFNGAFDKLMGGNQIPAGDMNDYATFAMAIAYPPNPNQLLDRTLRTTPAGNNEAAGFAAYNQSISGGGLPIPLSCNTCHTLPSGTNGLVIAGTVLQEAQQMKVPQLRNMYRKVGFLRQPGPQKSGFGFIHDGSIDTLTTFFNQPVFNPWPSGTKDDIVTFLMSLDTGTAPAVGYQFVLDQQNAGSTWSNYVSLTTARAAAGDLALTAHGVVDGQQLGLLYVPANSHFTTSRTGVGPFTSAQLQSKAVSGQAKLSFTAVTPGSGQRLAIDRDQDGVKDGDEAAVSYGGASPGCTGASTLLANSEPRVGNAAFGYTMHQAPANSFGVIALALGSASLPALGVQIHVDPLTAVPIAIASSPHGDSYHHFPIPPVPAHVGLSIHAQALWLDACGSEFWSASPGLSFTVRP
jgi:DNA-binding beta-propeller fold protein YncE